MPATQTIAAYLYYTFTGIKEAIVAVEKNTFSSKPGTGLGEMLEPAQAKATGKQKKYHTEGAKQG
ncbi:hypothetical protein KDH_19230 [Dictyobacter sp. S3.2.2.5]|uniref:Uncharacterized protein n=1 Tax=Dictyobacter halimunensis TaxID=3026934 RepID=A0ABQ6FLH6_9CHLR|nr:hypothetical protein KDH_19230 [Dictyobacter sp. S3.2.2.5]